MNPATQAAHQPRVGLLARRGQPGTCFGDGPLVVAGQPSHLGARRPRPRRGAPASPGCGAVVGLVRRPGLPAAGRAARAAGSASPSGSTRCCGLSSGLGQDLLGVSPRPRSQSPRCKVRQRGRGVQQRAEHSEIALIAELQRFRQICVGTNPIRSAAPCTSRSARRVRAACSSRPGAGQRLVPHRLQLVPAGVAAEYHGQRRVSARANHRLRDQANSAPRVSALAA